MRFLMNTGRTIKQGITVECKGSPGYGSETSRCFMHPLDMMEMGVCDGECVRVESTEGAIVLAAAAAESVTPGTIFVPYGPYANHIIPGATRSTGMPDFKSTPVTVEATTDRRKTVYELMEEMGGVAYHC
ncbi:MAG: molybdopterin dinucleotide-binding protein [Methanomicrobiaceae archaeon]|uniref:Formylmethanofuran dehydrogenase (Tungsten) subunit d n=1 Tax=hydrocarbon metagenome TaxID=938273 RepID=A0A0W8FJI6_9ZZZZ|nr:molybdopterin dinucleotide-binding protein [Methanomicrobiaceae archaeon]MDD5420259.1 molybdopterin dinucleotide binding domain-containing protein [Methanomicrobiaceae archaeon]